MENNSFQVGFRSGHKLRRLRINNFRSIVMNDFIEIKPITLLFGKNGSGKSSFLKAIKFIGNNVFPATGGETKYRITNHLDLGSFKDIVLNNDIKNKIEIDYHEHFVINENHLDEFGNEVLHNRKITNYVISVILEDSDKNENISTIQLFDLNKKLELKITPNAENQLDKDFVKKISQTHLSNNVMDLFSRKGEAGYPNRSIQIQREVNVEDDTLDDKIKKFIKYVDLLPFIDLRPDLRLTYFRQLAKALDLDPDKTEFINYWIDHLVNNIPLSAKGFFKALYISPFREKPKSEYILKNNKFDPEEYFGVLRLIDDEMEDYNPFFNRDYDESKLDFINSTLERLGLGKKIEIEKSEGHGKVIFTDTNNNKINLSESSSGLLHILPIIIASSFSLYHYEDDILSNDPEFSDVIMIEQPELHLHPALQSELMEFLCKAHGITYIIETHSEHMVRKLQVLIAQGKVNKSNVAIYYFNKDVNTGITSIEEMKMDESGLFEKDWPKGFFDEKMNLTFELLDAIRERTN